MIVKSIVAATAVSAGLLTGVAAPAAADVERRAVCSAGSRIDIDVDRDFNVYGIDVEINSRSSDENWRLVVTRNGKRIHSSTRATRQDYDDRYGEVDWEVLARATSRARATFVAKATNQITGETCRVRVTY